MLPQQPRGRGPTCMARVTHSEACAERPHWRSYFSANRTCAGRRACAGAGQAAGWVHHCCMEGASRQPWRRAAPAASACLPDRQLPQAAPAPHHGVPPPHANGHERIGKVVPVKDEAGAVAQRRQAAHQHGGQRRRQLQGGRAGAKRAKVGVCAWPGKAAGGLAEHSLCMVQERVPGRGETRSSPSSSRRACRRMTSGRGRATSSSHSMVSSWNSALAASCSTRGRRRSACGLRGGGRAHEQA